MTLRRASQQRGFTMVELLVAMVISLLIALVAISALTVTRQGFATVDASSQLRDNGRFASDLIQRLAVQSGFKDVFYATQTPTADEIAANIAPNITGFNNATSSSSDPLNSSTARTVGADGYGSDILILRYQTVKLNSDPTSTASDNSMIDCMGNASPLAATSRTQRMASILHVAVSQGELSLMCSTVNAAGTISTPQPIIQGVETFQVLYGTDGVTAGTAPTPRLAASDATYPPNSYLRADQMTVTGSGGTVATNDNWRRVRSIRIGMVLRGPANSSQEMVAQTLYPFGKGQSSSSTATAGSALSSTNDPGTVFSAPADGRLRQVVTFTVHLRNDQSL
ncbi:MAG: PilW family protein [Pseudomonadota bacterium]